MNKVRFSRRGIFPLRRLKIIIEDKVIYLKGNETKEILLDKGLFDICLEMDFWKSKNKLLIKEPETIFLKHYLNDLFYILGGLACIVLSVFAFLSIIPIVYLEIYLIVYFLPQMLFYFMRRDKYFRIEKKDQAPDRDII